MFILKPVFRMLLLSCFFIAGVVYGMPQSTETKNTISSWSEIAERYETFRDESYPLIVPGGSWLSYGSWESVQAELTSFVKGSWFWYFTASDYRINTESYLGKTVQDKINLLIYEDIYSGEIIIAKERKDGRYIEVYSQKTLPILEALALGMTTFEETARRRIAWQASVVPYDYAEPVVMRSASIPTPPGGGTNSGGNGTFNSMTQEEWDAIHSATNMWIAIGRQGTNGTYAYELTVHTPTSNTNRVDIFSKGSLLSTGRWSVASGLIEQDQNHQAGWTNSGSSAQHCYFRAADADLDSDGDGLANGRELYAYGSNPYNGDSDQDAVPDGVEIALYNTDPLRSDTDGDGLNDGEEIYVFQTIANSADGDNDGMPDRWEVLYQLNPLQDDGWQDPDDDGIPNICECYYQTDPGNPDSLPEPTIITTNLTISAALEAAMNIESNYPIVGIATGYYCGSGNVNISLTNAGALLYGISGNPEDVQINCGQNSGFLRLTDSGIACSGIMITNTACDAAFHCDTSSLLLQRCIISGTLTNVSPPSRGVTALDSQINIRNCSFNQCMSTNDGGVLYLETSTATVSFCTFKENRASCGAVISATASVCEVDNSILCNNTATGTNGKDFSGEEISAENCSMSAANSNVTQCVAGNPLLFADRADIQFAESVCVDAGASSCELDVTGSKRSALPDVGAYEWNDSDEDGSSDFWEARNDGDPASAAVSLNDDDHDGYLNIFEVKNGADPYNSLSIPQPTVTLNPGDSIQTAINNAQEYDIIKLNAGTYVQHDIRYHGKKIMLCGAGKASTFIDCAGNTCGIIFDALEARASVLSGLQVKNAGSQGIWISDASPTLLACSVISNEPLGIKITGQYAAPLLEGLDVYHNGSTGYATPAGGIYISSGMLHIEGSRISRNFTKTGNGAGIEANHATLEVIDCDIKSNDIIGNTPFQFNSWGDPWTGGGMFLQNTTAEIKDSNISFNSAYGAGGINIIGGNVKLLRCLINNNEATYDSGGGLKSQADSLRLESCALSFNDAAIRGGGAFLMKAQHVDIIQCAFNANRADQDAHTLAFMDLDDIGPKAWNSIFYGARYLWETSDDIVALGGCSFREARNCCFRDTIPAGDIVQNCFTNNPLFITDYELRTNSPCLGQGRILPGEIRDIDGQLFARFAPDIGCDERNGNYDTDQLPDNWELKYFETTNYGDDDDYDFDGLTNLQEYQLNLNPASPDSDGDGIFDAYDPDPKNHNVLYDLTDTFSVHYQAADIATGDGNPHFVKNITVEPELAGNIVSVKQVRVTGSVDDAFKIGGQAVIWSPELSSFSDLDVTGFISDRKLSQFIISLYDWTTNDGPNNAAFDGTFTVDYVSTEPCIDLVGYDADREENDKSVSELAEETPGVFIRADDGDPASGDKFETKLLVKAVGQSGLARQLIFTPYYRLLKINGVLVTSSTLIITNDSNEDVEFEITLNDTVSPGPKVTALYTVYNGTNFLGCDALTLASVKIDLDSDLDNDGDIDDEDEALENIGMGEIIRYNDDDDPANIEDDLQYMPFSVQPKTSGKVWFTYNPGRLRLWEDQDMTTLIPVGNKSNPTWNLDQGDVLPEQIYAEALTTTLSNAPEEIVLHRYWGGVDVPVSIRVTLTANLGHFAYFASIPDYINEYRGPDATNDYRLFKDQLGIAPNGITHNFVAMMSDDVDINIHDARAAGHKYYGDVKAAHPNAVVIVNASYFETTWPQGIAKGICVSDGLFMTNSRAATTNDDFGTYRGWVGRTPAGIWEYGVPENQTPVEPETNGSMDMALGGLLPLYTTDNGNMVPSGAFGYNEAGSNLIGWSTNGVVFFAATINAPIAYNPPINFHGLIDNFAMSGATVIYDMDGSDSIAFCHRNPFLNDLHLYGEEGRRHWPAIYTVLKNQRVSNYLIINAK